MASQADEYRILALLRRRIHWVRFSPELKEDFFSTQPSTIFQGMGLWFDTHPGGPEEQVPLSSLRMICTSQLGLNEEERDDLGKGLKNFRRYARKLDESVVLQMVASFIQRSILKEVLVESVDHLDNPAELDLQDIQLRLKHAADLDLGGSLSHGVPIFHDITPDMLTENREGAVGTAIGTLDKALNGGLGQGEFGVVAGAPNMGKTSILINFAVAASLQGHSVAYFTHEISGNKVRTRMYERIMGMSLRVIKRPKNFTKLKIRLSKLQKHPVTVFDYSASVTKVTTILRDVEAYNGTHTEPIGIIFVDYADLLGPSHSYSDYRFELGDIYKALRQIAVHFQVPLWTASQLKRGVGAKNKVASMEDLPEAFEAKSGIPDTILTLNQTPEEYEEGLIRIYVAKTRNVAKKVVVHLEFDTARNLLRDQDHGPD